MPDDISRKKTAENWHHMNVDEVIGQLKTSIKQGLTSSEADQRLAKYGRNEIAADKEKEILEI